MVTEYNQKPGYGTQPSVIRGGDFLFITHRCGRRNPETGEKNTTIETQTIQCLKKMKKFLEEAGASFDDLTQITVLLANEKDVQAMNDAYFSYFHDKYPARTLIITPLFQPEMLIQIGGIAYHPLSEKSKPAVKTAKKG